MDITTNNELHPTLFEQIKEATKLGHLEAMYEYKDYEKKRKNEKSDQISKSQAYKLRGRSRVEALLANPHYGLSTVKSSDAPNATQYLSKSKLIELDRVRVP